MTTWRCHLGDDEPPVRKRLASFKVLAGSEAEYTDKGLVVSWGAALLRGRPGPP